MARIQRRFLLRSRWTAVVPLAGLCHFEVIEVRGSEVTLRAVLTRQQVALPVAALEDSTVWVPGWHSLPLP
jgi:tryptophan-rich hypothetical protein